MTFKLFLLLSLLHSAANGDSFGSEFGPSATTPHNDDYIQYAGQDNQAGSYYSHTLESYNKLRYVGYHVEGQSPFVVAFTPQCRSTDSPQSCGVHTLQLSTVTGNWVSETLLTYNGQLQWQQSDINSYNGGSIRTLDVGQEVMWADTNNQDDYYNTLWIVDTAGYLYNQLVYGGCSNPPCGCAGTNAVLSWSQVQCTYTHSNWVDFSGVTGFPSTGVQSVSSGGYASYLTDGQCNVAIIAGNRIWWGQQIWQSTAQVCSWAQITGSSNIISVANGVDVMFAIDSTGTIKKWPIQTTSTTAPTWSSFTAVSGWPSSAGSPVAVDAYDASHVAFVDSNGVLYTYSSGTFTAVQNAASVYITKDGNGNIEYPTNAYFSVGPDAIYVGDSSWTSTSGNNWRYSF